MTTETFTAFYVQAVLLGVFIGLGVAFIVAANHLARKISKAAEPDEPDGEWDA